MKNEKSQNAVLKLPNAKEIELEVITPTIGECGLDTSGLYAKTGYFSHDPSFTSTSSCTSSITYINGAEGILMHRGHKIQDLASNYDCVSCAHLILQGSLPSKEEREAFEQSLVKQLVVLPAVKKTIESFPRQAHPMSMLMAATSHLASTQQAHHGEDTPEQLQQQAIRVIGNTIAASAYILRYITEAPFIEAHPDKSLIQNITEMLFGGRHFLNDHRHLIEEAFNKILILHLDHEQNASTSTVRMVASTEANLFASITAGIAALWGKLHGGANEAVVKMLHQISSVAEVPKFIDKAKDKNDPFRLMGFGHRVYKNYDPRAEVLNKAATEILSKIGKEQDNHALRIAQNLEELALQDEYFATRKLFPNVDFYSGIIYETLGIPSSFFTVIFAMSRVVGWSAQALEFLSGPNRRISRPRQIYTGRNTA